MRYTLIFSVLILISALILSVLPVNGEIDVYDKSMRLHVIANSDSEKDQELKLKVRDAILSNFEKYLDGVNDIEKAKEILTSKLRDIEVVASATIGENGFYYPVSAEICEEYYPVRTYENVSLPAGTYTSLKVKIGKAEGENWWCVLFPPLCTSAASSKDTLIKAGFTPNQVRFITETEEEEIVIKFKIVEFFKKVFIKK